MREYRAAVFAGLLFSAGCAADKSVFLISPALRSAPDPRVVVLPFGNETVDVSAAEAMRKLVHERFSRWGYLPLELGRTDELMREMGVTDGGQLPSVKPADIGRAFGADLLCYGTVEDFTFQNVGFVVRRSAVLRLKIVSAATGETVFEASGAGKDVKVFLDKDEAKKAFIEQLALKLAQNIFKTPLQKESEAAVSDIFRRVPRRETK